MPGIFDHDDGLLARIPVQYVSAAIDRMPEPRAATARIGAVEIEVPEFGRVRITCVLRRNPRWREHQFWSPLRADGVP
jgi:hypothetical protein